MLWGNYALLHMEINSMASEVTELVLYLCDIPAIPLADPTLIIRCLGAGGKNWRRQVEDALPLRGRTHGRATPAGNFRGGSLA